MKIRTKFLRTPLHDWHLANGGVLIWDDDPWAVVQGSDSMKEYEAVRKSTGLLDLFSTGFLEVTGRDAGKFIQRTFTNIVEDMEVCQARYGAFVNSDGVMFDEGHVFKFDSNRYIITPDGSSLKWFMRLYAEDLDAAFTCDFAEKWFSIAVQGPTSIDTLQPLVDKDLSDLKFFRFYDDVTIAGCKGWIARMGFTGERGYEISVASEDALTVWEALIEKGGVSVGIETIDLLRIEAGLMAFDNDFLSLYSSPWDLSMDKFIKLHPECVGTEALTEYQKVLPRRFKTLKISGDELPCMHVGIYVNKEAVGVVRSVAASPICGNIALAIIETPFAEDGTKVEVQMMDGTFAPAEVAPLSIFDPEKKKMRGHVK